ncbi:hypothetical protein WJX84_006121 [Apatococcus fuscideae]|uniref:Uncharacterized protein n=1 Tax=Apatococcus fuscideae TaxID=2026836 RepID=A0AAW1SNE6_9CHLO
MSEAAARDSCSVQHLLQPEAFALTSRLQDIFVRSLPRARLGPPHTIQEDTQKASAWHEQGCLDMGGPYSAGAGPVSQAVIRLYSVISTGDSCELHLSVNDLRGRGCSTDSGLQVKTGITGSLPHWKTAASGEVAMEWQIVHA